MSVAILGQKCLHYETYGSSGDWIVLLPGGRKGLEIQRDMARGFAQSGYRVLLHDRRNCGASDVLVQGVLPEYEFWASDMADLMQHLAIKSAWIGGSSSGARVALRFAIRHPGAVRGLLLWRVTGGAFAANRLANRYYSEYIDAAARGGMPAVCDTQHFSQCIEARSGNREALMSVDPAVFMATFRRWRSAYEEGGRSAVIGVEDQELPVIHVPVCVVPGNDKTHPQSAGLALAERLPNATCHVLFSQGSDLPFDSSDQWNAGEQALLNLFRDFMEPFCKGAPSTCV